MHGDIVVDQSEVPILSDAEQSDASGLPVLTGAPSGNAP